MTTGYYVFCIILVVLGLLGLVGSIMKINDETKKDLLTKMYENGDIDEKTYIKYSKNLL